MEIGTRILQLRKQKGITQQQLAEYLSVLPQTVSRWEAGGGTPDVMLLPKVATFFGVTMDELFGMHDMERIQQMVLRYSVLWDEKSFEEAMHEVEAGIKEAVADKAEEKRQQLLALKMHLLLQKGRQALKEADKIADQLIEETEEATNPLHLAVRLQKMQFDMQNGKAAKRLRESRKAFEEHPDMETLQIYFWALEESGQGAEVLRQQEHPFVKQMLKGTDENAKLVWEILFHGAAQTEDVNFFEEHFSEYEMRMKALANSKKSVNGEGESNCLQIRFLMASLFKEAGMKEKTEALKPVLLQEAEVLKNQEMLYRLYVEQIQAL